MNYMTPQTTMLDRYLTEFGKMVYQEQLMRPSKQAPNA